MLVSFFYYLCTLCSFQVKKFDQYSDMLGGMRQNSPVVVQYEGLEEGSWIFLYLYYFPMTIYNNFTPSLSFMLSEFWENIPLPPPPPPLPPSDFSNSNIRYRVL